MGYDALSRISDSLTYKPHSSFSTAKSIEDEIGDIASGYENLQCEQAAKAVSKHLKKKKKSHNLVTLDFPTAYHGLVVSDLNPGLAISESGKHYGIEYDGNVYCNVYPSGLPFETWVGSFVALDANTMLPMYPIVTVTPLY